jgi:glucose-1-phosphate cytidylyltransferase
MINKDRFDVIILCGGKGERLRPYTNSTPKPLTKIKNKEFLQYLIKFFLKNNFHNIIIACGYKSYLFKEFIKKNYKNEKKITVVDSGEADILKRIKDCEIYVKNNFFVCYGDAFATLNLKKYINFFKKNKKNNFSTIVTSFYNLQFGTLKVNYKSKKVLDFNEKPKIKEPINIGYFIFKKDIYKIINKFKIWIKFLKYITKNKLLKFYNFNGLHLTFNNYGELQIAKSKMGEIENFLKTKIN